jgi:hypothetical protein
MSQGMASKAEVQANVKVQGLKPLVDEADKCDATTLGSQKLADLIAAVQKSINARLQQKALPQDGGGHGARVEKEQGILRKLNSELIRRKNEASKATDEKNVKSMTGLPANSTWGGPKK